MAIPHAASGQAIDVRPLGAALATGRTVALVKTDTLEVFRLVLRPGRTAAPVKVPGVVTLQCLEGRVELTVEGVPQTLAPGQLVFLAGGAVHGLTALEDASLLVTVLLAP
jgi:quercetin dioxygenase-like cupin family protein